MTLRLLSGIDRFNGGGWVINFARSPGFLSKGQAKEIFLLKDKDFEELPQCGRLQTEFGWSTPKHIRDCAAAALARLGSFKELTEVNTPNLESS